MKEVKSPKKPMAFYYIVVLALILLTPIYKVLAGRGGSPGLSSEDPKWIYLSF